MSQVNSTTTMPLVTVTCVDALIATMTVVTASTSMGLSAVLDLDNDVPLPQIIPLDTTRGVAGFDTGSQQQPPLQMGPQCWIPIITEVYYAKCRFIGPVLICIHECQKENKLWLPNIKQDHSHIIIHVHIHTLKYIFFYNIMLLWRNVWLLWT